jgi:DNA-binding NtrC family response regulator
MKNVLAVSADETLLKSMRKNLSAFGFEVDTLRGAEHLFDKLHEGAVSVLVIDFILDDNNAAAICHKIKSDTTLRDLPIIILSDFKSIGPSTGKLGSFAVINKPVVISELVQSINEALEENLSTI